MKIQVSKVINKCVVLQLAVKGTQIGSLEFDKTSIGINYALSSRFSSVRHPDTSVLMDFFYKEFHNMEFTDGFPLGTIMETIEVIVKTISTGSKAKMSMAIVKHLKVVPIRADCISITLDNEQVCSVTQKESAIHVNWLKVDSTHAYNTSIIHMAPVAYGFDPVPVELLFSNDIVKVDVSNQTPTDIRHNVIIPLLKEIADESA